MIRCFKASRINGHAHKIKM
jgi:hypothetical protein